MPAGHEFQTLKNQHHSSRNFHTALLITLGSMNIHHHNRQEPKPLIFVAGMSRSGSMWTYNIIRKLLESAGITPVPDTVPPDARQVTKEAFRTRLPGNRIYCIKTHNPVRLDRKEALIICTHRDVRDAMLSFMRFMHCSFEHSLQVAESMMQVTDYYLGEPRSNVLPVGYGDVVSHPHGVIVRLADFLGISVDADKVAAIESNFSRERVKQYLNELDAQHVKSSSRNSPAPESTTTIRNLDGSFRIYDYKTGFQSRHITSRKEGEWRDVLSTEQQQQVNQLTTVWLKRYGYVP